MMLRAHGFTMYALRVTPLNLSSLTYRQLHAMADSFDTSELGEFFANDSALRYGNNQEITGVKEIIKVNQDLSSRS